jgi:branched-chain amino acid transport system permease protein
VESCTRKRCIHTVGTVLCASVGYVAPVRGHRFAGASTAEQGERPLGRRLLAIAALVLAALAVVAPAAAQTITVGEGDGPAVVRGTLEDGDEAVEGVDIVITTADGDEVVTATSGADGSFEEEIEESGDYVATIDVDSLPDGVELREEDRTTVEFSLQAGGVRTLIYPLGEGSGSSGVTADRALQLLVEGVKFGMIIALAAVGLSLIFGTTGLTNFAHGEMVTAGALVGWYLNVRAGIQLIPATVLAMLICFGLGYLIDVGFWGQLRRRGTGLIAQLVISIGLSILLRYFFLYLFGGRTRPVADYAVQQAIDLGPVRIAPKDIISVLLSIAVLVVVGLVLQKTRIGKAIRAVSDNRDLAESSGINVNTVIHYVWAAGFALAALGGILLGVGEQVSFQGGFRLLLLMFAGVTLGGLGTAYGALVGSLIVGIFVQMSTLFIPAELKNVGALVILILILLVRPQGILGQRERVG